MTDPSIKSRLPIPCLLRALGWALALGAAGGAANAGTLAGEATLRERQLLPPGAVFEAVLLDVTAVGAPARPVARVTREPAGAPPFRFSIAYDDAAIQPGRRYAVSAAVSQLHRPLFTAERPVPVRLDGSDRPLQLRLVAARRGTAEPEPGPDLGPLPASFEGESRNAASAVHWHLDLLPGGRYQWRQTDASGAADDIGRWFWAPAQGRLVLRGSREGPWVLQPAEGGALRKLDGDGGDAARHDLLQRLPAPALTEPRLPLTGMFSVRADGAAIALCADGRWLPVAMEAAYPALERAWRMARREPGQALLAGVDGVIASRPAAEANQPAQPTLVVEAFTGIWPGETCGTPLATSPLRGTRWKLVRLQGRPIERVERQREPHVVLATDAPRLTGSGGCNRLSGAFELDGERLTIGRVVATRMACLSGMAQERQVVQALEGVTGWRGRGSHLELLGSDGAVLARFEAAAPP